jgi:hypothetical protein
LNVTYQLLVYADDANLLVESIHTVKKNTEALLITSKYIVLEYGHPIFSWQRATSVIAGCFVDRTSKNNCKWYT